MKMKLIIEIPDEEYELIVNSEDCGLDFFTRLIASGTPISEYCDHCSGDYVETEDD